MNPHGQPQRCRFALLGTGPTQKEVAKALGSRDDCYVPGGVYGKNLLKAYASADVLFTPTITGTLDQVALEAQYAGLACVLPNAVAFPLALDEGKTGHLYKPLDTKDAVCALNKTLNNLDELKGNAREHMLKILPGRGW